MSAIELSGLGGIQDSLASSNMDGAAISTNCLEKRYDEVLALDGVSVNVEAGTTVGILGPNGAGKTTFLDILQGFRTADAGTVKVFNTEIERGLGNLVQRIGVTPQNIALPRLLQVNEILSAYSLLYDNPEPVEGLIKRLGLWGKRKARFSSLSGGQRRRLSLGMALLGRPDLLVLDEPTGDLDPQGRRMIWDLIREPRENGEKRTVILSTHQMDEAEILCDVIYILDHGRILAQGSPAELVSRFVPGHNVQFVRARSAGELGFLGDIEERAVGDKILTKVKVADLNSTLSALVEWQKTTGVLVEGLQARRNSLEDVFLTLTGRQLRD